MLASFEDGSADGWTISGAPLTGATNATNIVYEGMHSLAVTVSGLGQNDYPWVSTASPANLGALTRVTAHVWAPVGTQLTAKIFVADANYNWTYPNPTPLTPGAWTTLVYAVPSTVRTPFHSLGLQFNNRSSSTQFSGTLYVDSVTSTPASSRAALYPPTHRSTASRIVLGATAGRAILGGLLAGAKASTTRTHGGSKILAVAATTLG